MHSNIRAFLCTVICLQERQFKPGRPFYAVICLCFLHSPCFHHLSARLQERRGHFTRCCAFNAPYWQRWIIYIHYREMQQNAVGFKVTVRLKIRAVSFCSKLESYFLCESQKMSTVCCVGVAFLNLDMKMCLWSNIELGKWSIIRPSEGFHDSKNPLKDLNTLSGNFSCIWCLGINFILDVSQSSLNMNKKDSLGSVHTYSNRYNSKVESSSNILALKKFDGIHSKFDFNSS